MPKYSTAFGMDVHLRSTTVCALDADTGEAVTRRFPGNPWGEIAGWMDGFPGPSLAAYESGYLGFAPQRELAGLGVECVVAAVSKIPRSAADSASKNDSDMTQASLGYVGAVLPKTAFLPLFHAMASEDFALISSKIPSAYFTVGAAVTDTDEHFAQHHPKARFNDAELPLGAAAYTAVALGYIADHR